MTVICPEKIVNSGPMPLLPSQNVANLNKIMWNVRNPVLLRLLVCGEEKKSTGDCQYPDHIDVSATKKVCENSKNDLAQIYFRHREMDAKARSCIVIFIESYNLHKTDMLYKKYENTVNWLNIADEKPYLVVVCFGNPKFENDYTKAHSMLEQKMKAISKNEDLCDIIYASQKKEEVLNITHTVKFSIKAQQLKL